MKKIFLSVFTVLLLGILLGCKTESTTTTTTPVSSYGPIQTIEFYSINDLHGTAYSSLVTLSKMGRYLRTRNQNNPNVILLSAGDMFQGTAFSNYYYGRPLVEIMNSVGFDAFTIGNHEFDWGIDKIAAYNDGSAENGEADYPILAANILSVVDDTPMPWTDPYTIVEVSGIKVGIIGVIGQVYNSISVSRVEDFYFADEVQTVREYAFELRTVQNCDIVAVSLHGDDSSTNNALANLSGEYRIDALFNGHTHSNEFGTMERAGADLPYAQVNGGSDSLIAKITLTYNNDTNLVTQFSAQILGSADMGQTDSEIDSLIEEYSENAEYVSFISQKLATTSGAISRYDEDLAIWGASVVRDYAGVDFGMVNAGGFRVSIEAGDLTMGDLVEIYPFDNFIKTCEMTGQQLTNFYESLGDDDVVFDDEVSYSGGILRKNGTPVVLTAYYTVGAVDYIFDKPYYAFLDGDNIQQTSYLMRDLLAEDLLALPMGAYFHPANGTSYLPA